MEIFRPRQKDVQRVLKIPDGRPASSEMPGNFFQKGDPEVQDKGRTKCQERGIYEPKSDGCRGYTQLSPEHGADAKSVLLNHALKLLGPVAVAS